MSEAPPPGRRAAKGWWRDAAGNVLYHGDNLPILRQLPRESFDLIYIDPPFNTGREQVRLTTAAVPAPRGAKGSYAGFGGRYARREVRGRASYADSFADYLGFLRPRLQWARRLLSPRGSLFFHIDWREAAACRLLLEKVFGGREHLLNEIIWAYDFGARPKRAWPRKHDTIYWFAKDPKDYICHLERSDRLPYLAPKLAGEAKARRGKTPTDVWWNTIVPTAGREKTGYPTQKPLAVLERIVKVHSEPDSTVLDFFAGSGTAGEAAAKHGRRYVLIDSSARAVQVMRRRLGL